MTYIDTLFLQMWTYANYSFTSPPLNGLTPFQVAYGSPSTVIVEIETNSKKVHFDLSKDTMSF